MYKELSKYYDEFMASEDYDSWLAYAKNFIPPSKSGIDFACGSGKFTIGLAKNGYNVYGTDISPYMLSQAKQNALKNGLDIMFVEGSYDSFVPSKQVDFATCMCDGINYTKNSTKAFKNIYNALNSSGVFMFDISSEYKLSSVLGNNTFTDSTDKVTYIWNNFYDKKKKCIDIELTFFTKEGNTYVKSTESQTQYIHTQKDILSSLGQAGFINVQVFGGVDKSAVKSDTQRLHFVAYKMESNE